jgi:hypothetical protein
MPCDCGPTPAVDIAALVTAAHQQNGDAAIGLDPNAATPATIDLPCGSYYVAGLSSSGALTIAVHGRAALFVDGDVSLGSLRVDFDPMAELDLVVRGNLTSSGDLAGSMPSSLRVWLGGTSLRVASGRSVAAGVWAPSATLLSDGSVTIIGAIAVGSVSASGGVTVRFDPRIGSGGSECGDAPVPPLD